MIRHSGAVCGLDPGVLNPAPSPLIDYPPKKILPIRHRPTPGVDTFARMGMRPLVGATLAVVCLAGCASPAVSSAGPTTTVTVSAGEVTPPTRTVTATVTATRTATASPSAVPDVAGPRDATDEFKTKAGSAGMSRDQLAQIVEVLQEGNGARVLTTLRRPVGGWDCQGTPAVLAGVRLRFATILYEDRGVFRDCQL